MKYDEEVEGIIKIDMRDLPKEDQVLIREYYYNLFCAIVKSYGIKK